MLSIFRSKNDPPKEMTNESSSKEAPIRRFSWFRDKKTLDTEETTELTNRENATNREMFDLQISYDNESVHSSKSAKSFKTTPKSDSSYSASSPQIIDLNSEPKSITSARSRSKSISFNSIVQTVTSAGETDDGSDFRLNMPLEKMCEVAPLPVSEVAETATKFDENISYDDSVSKAESVESTQKSIESSQPQYTMTLDTNSQMIDVTLSNSGIASSPNSDITDRSPWEQDKPTMPGKPSIIGISEREYVSYVHTESKRIPFHRSKPDGPCPVYVAGIQDPPKVRQRYFTPENKDQYKHFVYPPKNSDSGKTALHFKCQLNSLMNPTKANDMISPREPRDFRMARSRSASAPRSRSNTQGCENYTPRDGSASRSSRHNVESEINRLKSENIDLYYTIESLKFELQSLSQSSLEEVNAMKEKQHEEIERIQNEFQMNHQDIIRQSLGNEPAAVIQLTGLLQEKDEALSALQTKFDEEISVLKLRFEVDFESKNTELTTLTDTLSNKESELRILNKLLSHLESELTQHKQLLSTKDAELEALNQSLSSKGFELAELQETLTNQEEEQNTLKQLLATKNSNLAALELALANRSDECESTTARTATPDELDTFKQLLEEKETELEALNEAYFTQKAELNALKASLLTHPITVAEESQHSSSSSSVVDETVLNELKATIETKVFEVLTMKNMLSVQDSVLTELKGCLQTKAGDINTLQQSLDTKEEEIANLQQWLQVKDEDISALNEQLAENETKILDYEQSQLTHEQQRFTLNELLSTKESELIALKEELLNQEDINLITETIDNKNVKLDKLQRTISVQTEEIATLKQTISELRLSVSQHEQYSNELATQVNALKLISENNLKQIAKESSQETSMVVESLHKEYKVQLSKQEEAHQKELAELQSQLDALLLTTKQFKSVYTKEYKQRKAAHNKLLELNGNIRVVCRVRPILEVERNVGKGGNIAEYPEQCNDEIVINRDCHLNSALTPRIKFEYDRVFQPTSTQNEVFEAVQPLCVSVLDGYNVCIFAYGQTGSGKTYTMEGSLDDPGVVPRAISQLFSEIDNLRHIWEYEITFSLLEIYNENIFDLLVSGGGKTAGNSGEKLDVRQTPTGNVVPGLTDIVVTTPEQVNELMRLGQKNRAVGSHDMNERSSRSHSIVTLVCRGENKIDNTSTFGKLHLIDLAGSERVSKTDASGIRLTEAQNINKSLSALGDVINALGDKKSTHVPYRNSKLTFLLQDSLGGNSKMLMFVAISPAVYNVGETLCSLNFASRCRNVELGQAKRQITSGTSEASSGSSKTAVQTPQTPRHTAPTAIPTLIPRNTPNSSVSSTPRSNQPIGPPPARLTPRVGNSPSSTSISSKSLKTVKIATTPRCESSKSVASTTIKKSGKTATDSDDLSLLSTVTQKSSTPLNDEDSYA